MGSLANFFKYKAKTNNIQQLYIFVLLTVQTKCAYYMQNYILDRLLVSLLELQMQLFGFEILDFSRRKQSTILLT